MLIRHVKRATLVVGAVLAAALFFLGGAALRLLMGPISLGPFAGAIEDALNHSVSGVVVRFDQAVLEWSRPEGKVNLIVLGTKVFDSEGRIIAQAPKADIDFDAAGLVAGHLSLKRLALIGAQLTGVRSADGKIRLGFGLQQEETDLFATIRMILQSSNEAGSSFESFSVRDARVAFRDEPTGLFVVSPDATFTLQSKSNHFEASFDAAVEISGVATRVAARATLSENGRPEKGTVDLQGISLPALVANSAKFAALKPYRLTGNLSASLELKDGDLTAVAFQSDASGALDVAALKTPLVFSKLSAKGRYDFGANRIELDMAQVAGERVTANAKAQLDLTWKDAHLSGFSGDLQAESLKLDFPEWLFEPLRLDRLALKASYDREQARFIWEQTSIQGDGLSAELSGAIGFGDGSPALQLSANLGQLSVQDLLRHWPRGVGEGARSWMDANISQGQVGPVRIEADFAPGALDQDVLPENSLSLTFPFEGATATYLKGMTPLTNARGEGKVSGDSFTATVESGAIGPIAISGATVAITGFHVSGAPARIKSHALGKMSDVLTLVDEDRLGYAKRFGINPASASGNASIDVDFNVPTIKEVGLEQIQIGVQAKLADFGLPIDQRRKLEHASVTLNLDTSSLSSQGTGNLSGVPVTFKWTEDFNAPGITTRIDLAGRLDEQARANLGLIEPTWLTGAMPMTLSLTGRRFHFSDGAVRADLTNAAAEFPLLNIAKRPGVAMNGSANLHFDDTGAVTVNDLALTGNGFDAHGRLSIAPDGRLISASFSDFRSGANNDFALDIETLRDNGLAVRIDGRSLDATRFFGDDKKDAKPAGAADSDSGLKNPLTVNAKLGRALFRDDLAFHDLNLAISFAANERLTGFSLDATGPVKGRITGGFTTAKSVRSLSLKAEDAGNFIRTFTGFSSIRGGTLEAQVSFAPDDPAQADKSGKTPPYDYLGTITLSDIVVMDQPFFARLFAAGSFDGALHLLQGEGISINKVTAPFSMRGKTVTINDGRASGNAVGGTFEGVLDRRTDRLELTGTMVPAYGVNGVLGSVPILGDILASRRGEGVFGVTYAVKGNLNEPSLTTNPLSLLTPGILRRIFEFATPKIPTEPQPVASPPVAQPPTPPEKSLSAAPAPN